MKLLSFLSSAFFLFAWFFSCSSFSMREEVVFQLKRETKKSRKQLKAKRTIPLKFKRKSFSYSKDFLIFNERLASDLKKGAVLRVNIPYSVIASFTEAFPVYGIVTYPFKGIVSGKIKALKNTNKAFLVFDDIILNGKKSSIESFPVFVSGDLRESLLKDIALNFFKSLPSVLSLALRTQVPQAGIHFINTDLKNKMGKLSIIEAEKKQSLQYLEISNTKLLKLIIR